MPASKSQIAVSQCQLYAILVFIAIVVVDDVGLVGALQIKMFNPKYEYLHSIIVMWINLKS